MSRTSHSQKAIQSTLTRISDDKIEEAIWGRELQRRRVFPWHAALVDGAQRIIEPQIQRGSETVTFTWRALEKLGHTKQSAETAVKMGRVLGLLKLEKVGKFDAKINTQSANLYAVNDAFLEKVTPANLREAKQAIIERERLQGNENGTLTYLRIKVRLEKPGKRTTPEEVLHAYEDELKAVFRKVMKRQKFGGEVL